MNKTKMFQIVAGAFTLVALLSGSLLIAPVSANNKTAPFGYYPGTDHPLCPPLSTRSGNKMPAYGKWDNTRNYRYSGDDFGCRTQKSNSRFIECPECDVDPLTEPWDPPGNDDDKDPPPTVDLGINAPSPIDKLNSDLNGGTTPAAADPFSVEPSPDAPTNQAVVGISITETSGKPTVNVTIGGVTTTTIVNTIQQIKDMVTTRSLPGGKSEVVGINLNHPRIRQIDRDTNGALSNALKANKLDLTSMAPTAGRWDTAGTDSMTINFPAADKFAKFNVYRNGSYIDTVIRENGSFRAKNGTASYSSTFKNINYRDRDVTWGSALRYSIVAILPNGKQLLRSADHAIEAKSISTDYVPQRNDKGWWVCPDQKYNKWGPKPSGSWDSFNNYTNSRGAEGGCYIE